MVRRSTPQAKIDAAAFPVRVWFYIPENGLGLRYDAMSNWLVRILGPSEFAWHGGGRSFGGDRFALYFRTPKTAADFAEAFPDLELADGTASQTYSSPHLRLQGPG